MVKGRPTFRFCILMDLLGCATYLLPVLGEWFDILWAPVSAFIFYKSFGGRKAIYGALFNFVEEILPGTDIIPTFTIVWIWRRITDNSTPLK